MNIFTTKMLATDAVEYTCFPSNVTAFTTKRTLGRDRERLCQMLSIGDGSLFMPHQTHSDRVLFAGKDFASRPPGERKSLLEGIDAVFTNLVGGCVGVSTADCIPVLLHDAAHEAVAAIHAGWRGTVLRIVQKTIAAMRQTLGTAPGQLRAVIGPGISQRRFEVGDEVFGAFRDAGFDMPRIAIKTDKWHLDLQLANRMLLLESGLPPSNIYTEAVCTYDSADFFSARREQSGSVKCGRNFSGIMLNS